VERLERHPIDRSDITATLCKEMLEDIHLIEAALATDKTLLSLDKQVRRHFKLFLPQLPELEAVSWQNPAEAEEILDWLEKGAPPDEHRMLGYRATE
jgi:hypothetical protein